MRKTMAIVLSVVVLGCARLMAADDAQQVAKEKSMEKVGAMKGRIVTKSQVVGTLLDMQASGINDVYPAIQKIQGQVNANIAKLLQEENAKPQEMRNVTLVDNLNKKSLKSGEMWTEFSNQWNAYAAKRVIILGVHNTLYTYVFDRVRTTDEYCVATGVDVEVLVPILTAVEKRWDDMKVEISNLNTTMKAFVTTWEAFAKE